MGDLYSRIENLCRARGTTITALCKKAGISRTTLSELKSGRTKTLNVGTLKKIATSLEVSMNMITMDFSDNEPISVTFSIDELKDYISNHKYRESLENISDDYIKMESTKHEVSDMDIKMALFGDDEDITDAMYEEVKDFAAFIKMRRKKAQ